MLLLKRSHTSRGSRDEAEEENHEGALVTSEEESYLRGTSSKQAGDRERSRRDCVNVSALLINIENCDREDVCESLYIGLCFVTAIIGLASYLIRTLIRMKAYAPIPCHGCFSSSVRSSCHCFHFSESLEGKMYRKNGQASSISGECRKSVE